MGHSSTSKSKPRRRSQLARSWSELWPVAVLITVFGVAAVMQVGACARVTVIQSDLQQLAKQETAYEADIQALRCELAGLRDVSALHDYMISSGFTKESAVVNVTVEGLPGELLEALPRTEPVVPASAASDVAGRSGTASGGETGAVIASLAQ